MLASYPHQCHGGISKVYSSFIQLCTINEDEYLWEKEVWNVSLTHQMNYLSPYRLGLLCNV